MRNVTRSVVAALGIVVVCGCSGKVATLRAEEVAAAAAVPSPIAHIALPVPPEESARRYLGISEEGTFEIAQVKTDVLLIEIFSMYCPHCQREAPVVNELYQAIQNRGDLKERMKIIGIGAGNSDYEVGVFREKYAIAFPLIPDKYNKVAQALKVNRTPTFVGIKVHEGGDQEQFYCQSGPMGKVPEFLAEMVKLSGLEKER